MDHAGAKRPVEAVQGQDRRATKRRRVHHALAHSQQRPSNIEPAPQDQVFTQGQLLRSIAAALVGAGFDSVKPSALEMFRSHTEEYILKFLTYARQSMNDGRRTKPTAYDFISSLAQMPNVASASHLIPQLGLRIPQELAFPAIPNPDPALPEAPDFSQLLEPLMTKQPPSYVPKHFPPLPPRHAWQSSDVYAERERDARKMREKATEEGAMAELALRKLAAAAKAGALKVERKRQEQIVGELRSRNGASHGSRHVRLKEDTFGDVLKDLGTSDEVVELGIEGTDTIEEGMDLGMPEGVIVNHDMAHWRRGKHRSGLHAYV